MKIQPCSAACGFADQRLPIREATSGQSHWNTTLHLSEDALMQQQFPQAKRIMTAIRLPPLFQMVGKVG
jgi:hypothetical protein